MHPNGINKFRSELLSTILWHQYFLKKKVVVNLLSNLLKSKFRPFDYIRSITKKCKKNFKKYLVIKWIDLDSILQAIVVQPKIPQLKKKLFNEYLV